ncbi:MAG: type II toxin-antitoxin system VapC family toxin [Pseudonocardiales bacterium]|nr:type II toxin-antitoxin system VapC family toxin [Pseudonocardiales bacterium]
MTRFLLDTAVFLHARGREHPYRDPCRELLRHFQEGSLVGEASVELVQEFGHVLRRRGLDGRTVRDQALAAAALCRLHDFGEAELRLALNLVVAVPALGMRDAVHAATALRQGIGLVVSPDKAFDQVPGVERLDPAGAVTRLLASPPAPRPPT